MASRAQIQRSGRGRVAANTEVLSRNPEILGGAPVFTGTRVPGQNLIDYFASGKTLDAFLDDFPSVPSFG